MKCKECCFYDLKRYVDLGGTIEDGRGVCRSHPPVPIAGDKVFVVGKGMKFLKWRWHLNLFNLITVKSVTLVPSVSGDADWCGEFRNVLCDSLDPYFLNPVNGDGISE